MGFLAPLQLFSAELRRSVRTYFMTWTYGPIITLHSMSYFCDEAPMSRRKYLRHNFGPGANPGAWPINDATNYGKPRLEIPVGRDALMTMTLK
jgi:hypothetical protein